MILQCSACRREELIKMHSLFMILYILSVLFSLFILCMSIFTRRAPRSLFFSYLALAIFLYTSGFLFEVNAGSYEAAVTAAKLQYLGIPFIAPFLFLFVCEYCAKIKIRLRHIIPVMIVPLTAVIFVMLWPYSRLFYTHRELALDVLIPRLRGTVGPVYILFFAYSYLISICSVGIVAYCRKKGNLLFRRQTSSLILGAVIPVTGNMINVLKLGSPDYDITPVLFSIECLILGYSIFKKGLYNLEPIAHDQIIENMNDGFILVDMQGHFIDANSSAKKLFPQLSAIESGGSESMLYDIPLYGTDNIALRKEFDIIDEAGIKKHYQAAQNLIKNNGKRLGRCIMIYDVTDVKQRLDEASLMAEHDTLTGLINRGTLYRKGEGLFAKFGPESCAAVLMMDIDYFKSINDTYGHINGDEVLKQVADVLVSRLNAADLIGRYGGEEFCVFLSYAESTDIMILAENLRESIEMLELMLNDERVKITISIGTAVYDSGRHRSFESLISDADTALYDAKDSGRNCVKLFGPESGQKISQ